MPGRKDTETFLVALLAVALVVLCIVILTSACRNPFALPARVEMRLGDDWQTIRANSTHAFQDWEKKSETLRHPL